MYHRLEENLDGIIKNLTEGKYKLYHKTFTDAADEALKFVKKKGFDVDEDSWFTAVSTGGRYGRGRPATGKTHRFTVELTKNGKPSKPRRVVEFQVYGMDSGKYELNMYIS